MKIEQRYLDGSYLQENPNWDRQDSRWKASQVITILEKHNITPKSICEVGCGSGDVLRCLQTSYPDTYLAGYDVSPQVVPFWQETDYPQNKIQFCLGNFHELNKKKHDLLLILDVFEHVRDPFTFLEASQSHADYFIFHIPLDLSAFTVARRKPLLNVRHRMGHLHFYTKDLALETLTDCGYKIVDWQYTGASNSVSRSIKTRLANVPRQIACLFNKDWGVRILGGETLIILAKKTS